MTQSLEVQEVTFRYRGGQRPAVEDVSLRLEPGTFTALLGPNGSGKSTLLSLLGGLLHPTTGRALLGDLALAGASRPEVARTLAFLPAKAHMPYDYTAREVVLMGRHPFGRGTLLESPLDLDHADRALTRALALPFAVRPCLELSSGERQRVLLARVLCQDVPVLLLDEPTSAQDAAHVLDLFALLAELAREGRTVVVATHSLNAAARHADRLVVLQDGRTVADGSPSSVLTRDLLANVFAVDALLDQDEDGVTYAVPRTRKA